MTERQRDPNETQTERVAGQPADAKAALWKPDEDKDQRSDRAQDQAGGAAGAAAADATGGMTDAERHDIDDAGSQGEDKR